MNEINQWHPACRDSPQPIFFDGNNPRAAAMRWIIFSAGAVSSFFILPYIYNKQRVKRLSIEALRALVAVLLPFTGVATPWRKSYARKDSLPKERDPPV
jgi:hypothetical protein